MELQTDMLKKILAEEVRSGMPKKEDVLVKVNSLRLHPIRKLIIQTTLRVNIWNQRWKVDSLRLQPI